MDEFLGIAEHMVGMGGGGPLVSAGNDDHHENNVHIDPYINVDAGNHDSHNSVYNYYDHESDGGADHHGGGHHHGDPQVMEMQMYLREKGLYHGAVDGIWGPHTQAAWEAEQAGHVEWGHAVDPYSGGHGHHHTRDHAACGYGELYAGEDQHAWHHGHGDAYQSGLYAEGEGSEEAAS